MENPNHYECELSWRWHGDMMSFPETYRFSVKTLDEIPQVIKDFIVYITRRYAGDVYEGRVNRYGVSIGILRVLPVYETFYLYPDPKSEFLKNEWDYAGELLVSHGLFVDGDYQKDVCPNNIDKTVAVVTYEELWEDEEWKK